MNRTILIGRLTKDPDFGTTNSGVSYCRFTLAVPRVGSKDDTVDFINILTWRTTAELAHKYLKKGDKCGVVGRIQIDNYTAQDGSKKTQAQVIADEIEFLQPKSEKTDKPAPDLTPIDDDDSLPF